MTPLDSTAACAVAALPRVHLVLAIAQAQQEGQTVQDVQIRMWRERAEEVAAIFAAVETVRGGWTPETGIGLAAERVRQVVAAARRAAPKARGGRGLTMREIAERAGMDRATLAALMEHHGFLELAPCGPGKNRRLVTDAAISGGLGDNVYPGGRRVGAVEGYGRAAPFAVFYADRLEDILWCLDHPGIAAEAARHTDRAARLRWLLEHHGYLPGAELARISGYSLRSIKTAQAARIALAGYDRGEDWRIGREAA